MSRVANLRFVGGRRSKKRYNREHADRNPWHAAPRGYVLRRLGGFHGRSVDKFCRRREGIVWG